MRFTLASRRICSGSDRFALPVWGRPSPGARVRDVRPTFEKLLKVLKKIDLSVRADDLRFRNVPMTP